MSTENQQTISNISVDTDWAVRFLNYVQDISNEEMQKIWANILVLEIKKTGTVSLRDLHELSICTLDEANEFYMNIELRKYLKSED